MYFLALKRSTLGFCRLLKDRSLKKWEKHRAHTLSTRQQVNHCWIIRDSERMRLLKSPRSLSVYILNLCIPHQRCKMRVSFSWGQNDLGTIFIRLNSLEKSRSRKKKKKTRYAISRYPVTPLRDLLTTLLNPNDVLEDTWTVKHAFSLLRLT